MKKILLVGIGNPIRQDDGIGPYCVNLLKEIEILKREKRELVDYMVVHQLDMIHCEAFARYSLIIFIDADAEEGYEPFRKEEVNRKPESQPFTSHIGSIPDILSLTAGLYGVMPQAYLVAIRGLSFEVGEELSSTAVSNAQKAIVVIKNLIDQFFPLG